LRPMGRDTRGVRSMRLTGDDLIVSMDILPAGLAEIEEVEGAEEDLDLTTPINEDENLETDTEATNEKTQGPWVLVVTRGGYGKCLVDEKNELMIVTSRGIVMRQSTDAIACQSRTARGVRLQKLDAADAIVGATLVPPALEEEIEEAEILSGDATATTIETIAETSEEV